MAFKDLRSFLAKLEEEGQLLKYTDKVVPEPDIRNISRASVDMGHTGPAVLMDNILGHKDAKIAVNVHGSWANHALMLGMPKSTTLKEQFFELDRRWDREGQVEFVDNAPCQEVIIEKDINLLEMLPLYKINENDGGFYLSKASVVSADPDEPDNFDKINVGIYRLQVQDQDTIAMQGLPFHDIAIHIRKAEERNEPLPVAICLGVEPMLSFIASTPLEYDESEYKFASAINGIPTELTHDLNGLPVPAGSEYVLEGEILPRVRVPEGPFGEYPGSYSGARQQVIIKIKRITHRKDPIFENLYLGRSWSEIDTLLGLNTCLPLHRQLRETMPEVKCVNAIYQHGLTVIIATDQRFGGYAKSVAFRLFSTPHGTSYAKNCILVDGDVDPFNLEQVMWAMSTRLRGKKDVIVIEPTPGMPLDPCTEPPGMGCKIILDCTTIKAPETSTRDFMMVEPIEGAADMQKVLTEMYHDLQKA